MVTYLIVAFVQFFTKLPSLNDFYTMISHSKMARWPISNYDDSNCILRHKIAINRNIELET